MRGQIYFIKGNVRIQITTDERIYFYLIDPDTQIPTLENVMHNFMGCSQMMFGSRVRFCVTFKQNEQDFHIWCRKYFHNFKVNISSEDLEGAVGANLSSTKQYIIGKGDKIDFYDINMMYGDDSSQSKFHSLKVPQSKSKQHILYMATSQDELCIGLCVG